MRIEHFMCWMCEHVTHYSHLVWKTVRAGKRELICDDCVAVLQEKQAA